MCTVLYYTLWSPCYIHTCSEGRWTSLLMTPHSIRKGWMQIHIEDLDEFVFTDGVSQWDNPSPGTNYTSKGLANIAVYRGSVIEILMLKQFYSALI